MTYAFSVGYQISDDDPSTPDEELNYETDNDGFKQWQMK